MIKLSEILHTIQDSKKEGLTDLNNWKIQDADFMEDMGFKAAGAHHYAIDRPKMTVYHKKNVGFVLEDKTKNTSHVFPKFDAMSEYFSKYSQSFENQPYV